MKVKGKVLNWGNSFGIRIGKSEAIQAGLFPNEDVEIEVQRKITKVKDIFGTLEKKADTEKALLEIDKLFGEK